MPTTQITNAKEQLAAVISRLEEKRRNPWLGTPLGELADEVQKMREVYGLSYAEIAEHLNSLTVTPKLKASVAQVRAFCKFIAASKRRQKMPATAASA